MAAYKSEFLAQHYKGRLHPLRHYIFAFADRLARFGSFAPALTNTLLTGPLTGPLVKRIAGVAQERQLPRLAPRSFQNARISSGISAQPDQKSAPTQAVLLWPDTWNNYYHPQTLAAAECLLTQAGFADWLAAQVPDFAVGRLKGAHILLHGHCHHKAVFGGPASEIAFLRQAGATVEPIQAGCCGMAGPFGFEADKFEVSKAIANDGLLPAVESAGPMTIIAADGFSCREQIAQLGCRQALHFAEILAYDGGCGTCGSFALKGRDESR
jgi:Fe-S oxidoreductase